MALGLSILCPTCRREFRNISPEWIGRKAKCSCGTVVLLDHQPIAVETPVPTPPQVSTDSLTPGPSAYQIPPETVSDVVAEVVTPEVVAPPVVRKPKPEKAPKAKKTAPPPAKARQAIEKPPVVDADAKRQQQTKSDRPKPSAKPKKENTKRSQTNASATAPAANAKSPLAPLAPPDSPTKRASKSAGSKKVPRPDARDLRKRSAKSKKLVPNVPVSVEVAKVDNRAGVDQPLFSDTYGDLDSILDGAGDASPLMIPQTPPAEPKPEEKAYHVAKQKSSIGFYSALVAGTIAIWFGFFVVIAKFYQFEIPVLSDWSTQMQAAATSNFGFLDVPIGIRNMFAMLSWVLWTVALFLMITGIAQVVNAFGQLLLRRHLLKWIDICVVGLALVGVIALVGLIMNQSSFQTSLQEGLDKVQGIQVGGGFEDQHKNQLKAEYAEISSKFNFAMYFNLFAVGMVMVFSTVRVFSNFFGVEKSQE